MNDSFALCILLAVVIIGGAIVAPIVLLSGSFDGAEIDDRGSVGSACPNNLLKQNVREASRYETVIDVRSQYCHVNISDNNFSQPYCHYHIRNSDFASGTLRLRHAGVYVLDEDILFDPNPHNDHLPRPNQHEYATPAYSLGFFAGMTVEHDDIIIDLNHKTFRASPLFSLQQPFFASIELGSQPFISGDGPTNFGNTVPGTERVIVRNGAIVDTPHHAIHGLGAQRVYIHDVVMANVTVAALHCSGCFKVVISDVVANGSRRTVPVLGTYSNARFVVRLSRNVLDNEFIAQVDRDNLRAAITRLDELLQDAASDVTQYGYIDPLSHPEAHALFDNAARVIDGNAYGMVFHPLGAAVNAFGTEYATDKDNQQITITRSVINGVSTKVTEVVGLRIDGKMVRGPLGDLLRITDNIDKVKLFNENGSYVGNALSDAQILLGIAVQQLPIYEQKKFPTLHIPQTIIDWFHGVVNLSQVYSDDSAEYLRNGDTMFHVNKGAIGLRIDSASQVCVDRVIVKKVHNQGNLGNCVELPGETSQEEASYTTSIDGGHPLQGLQKGYMGGDARGVSIAASEHVYVQNCIVETVVSDTSHASGFHVFNNANDVHFSKNVTVRDVTSVGNRTIAMIGKYVTGAKSVTACGVHVSGAAAHTTHGIRWVTVKNVTSSVIDVAYDHVIDAYVEPIVKHDKRNAYEL